MTLTRNGWTAAPLVRTTITAPGCADTGDVRAGDVAAIFQHFTTAFDAQVEPLYAIGGYRSPAYNTAVGGDAASNHMSGTALDFNGDRHPYELKLPAAQRYANYNDGFWDVQVAAIRALLTRYSGVIAWGLDFNWGYRDAMHFEIRGTAAQVAAVAAKLTSKSPAGTDPAPVPEEDDMRFPPIIIRRKDGAIATQTPVGWVVMDGAAWSTWNDLGLGDAALDVRFNNLDPGPFEAIIRSTGGWAAPAFDAAALAAAVTAALPAGADDVDEAALAAALADHLVPVLVASVAQASVADFDRIAKVVNDEAARRRTSWT